MKGWQVSLLLICLVVVGCLPVVNELVTMFTSGVKLGIVDINRIFSLVLYIMWGSLAIKYIRLL